MTASLRAAGLAPVALGLFALACQPAGEPRPSVTCRNLDTGYEAVHAGDDALVACVRDPAMQAPGQRREARLGPGRFDFGDGERIDLDGGWTVRGAGADHTHLYATRRTRSVYREGIFSALFVNGPGVALVDFTFHGDCRAGPSPEPGCEAEDSDTLVAIVVACGWGWERGPDCDVDGLRVENVRVLAVKTPFVATSGPPSRDAGRRGLFANFLDFTWTIRNFQVSGTEDEFRYARVIELGNAATPDHSQGPGVGVSAPRRYVLDIEDTRIDTHIGKQAGAWAGVLTMSVTDDRVSLTVNVRRSRLRGTERVVGVAAGSLSDAERDGGRATFRCEDSELVANHAAWGVRLASREPGAICPPFEAALSVGEFDEPGGTHHARAELVRCTVRVDGWLEICPQPASVELPSGASAPHASLCLEDATLDPPPRGEAAIGRGPC